MAVLTDPIADFLTRFKNASRANLDDFVAPYSNIKAEMARILKDEGYVWNYELDSGGAHPMIRVKLKYIDGRPVLTDLKRQSRPGRRQYVGAADIPRVLGGMGISIVSTSKGLMTGHQAKRENIGGELLATIW